MTVKTELLRCTKEGSNVFFLLNYLRRVKIYSITRLCWKHQGFGILPRFWALNSLTLNLLVRNWSP